MQTPQDARDLADLLHDHPTIVLACLRHHRGGTYILAQTTDLPSVRSGNLPLKYKGLEIRYQEGPTIHPLILRLPACYPLSNYTRCQDEPIELGCQIQPAGANWLGTAGAPCAWEDPQGRRYGFLTNWHVAYRGPGEDVGRPQHQPTIDRPAIALLADYQRPNPATNNLCDAAICDALIEGYHTISTQIIGIGPIPAAHADAQQGDYATKAGRTTGLTHGRCTATGAAVRVDYGDFTAVYGDQDVYEGTDALFSGPGDSGSLILTTNRNIPASLLFAGGGKVTIGSPLRHVIAALGIDFDFSR